MKLNLFFFCLLFIFTDLSSFRGLVSITTTGIFMRQRDHSGDHKSADKYTSTAIIYDDCEYAIIGTDHTTQNQTIYITLKYSLCEIKV